MIQIEERGVLMQNYSGEIGLQYHLQIRKGDVGLSLIHILQPNMESVENIKALMQTVQNGEKLPE